MLSTCPSCRRQLQVPDEAAGLKACCPSCEAVFVVEAAEVPVDIILEPEPVSVPVEIVDDAQVAGHELREPGPLIQASLATGESYTATLARQAGMRASVWMILTVVFGSIRILYDSTAIFMTIGNEDLRFLITIPACGFIVLFVPMLVVMVFGIHALRTCGSRLLIGLAAASGLLTGLYGCCGTWPAFALGNFLFESVRDDSKSYLFALWLVLVLVLLFLGLAGFSSGITALWALAKFSRAKLHGPRDSK